MKYTQEMIEWIVNNRDNYTIKELLPLFNKRFNVDYSFRSLESRSWRIKGVAPKKRLYGYKIGDEIVVGYNKTVLVKVSDIPGTHA